MLINMIENSMTKTEFVDFIRKNLSVNDYDKPVSMAFNPKKGWKYDVIVPITQVLNDQDVIWLSNGFSDDNAVKMTVQNIMTALLECDNDQKVVMEVYGYNGELNEQFIYAPIDSQDTNIIEINENIYLWTNIDQISTYNKPKNEEVK